MTIILMAEVLNEIKQSILNHEGEEVNLVFKSCLSSQCAYVMCTLSSSLLYSRNSVTMNVCIMFLLLPNPV